MSTIFSWPIEDFNYLLESCDHDPLTPYILKHFSDKDILLEAGCGSGRFVKYLHDKGFNVQGIEYSRETIANVNRYWPELTVNEGDVLSLAFPDNHFSGIISIGVIEHFIEGPEGPLSEMYRVLKPGGKAIITVPSFNLLRKIKRPLRWLMTQTGIMNLLRKMMGKSSVDYNGWNSRGSQFKYYTYPEYGQFYEYRMTGNEFREALAHSGFSIIEDVPMYHTDGLYHEFGRLFASYDNRQFNVYSHGKLLNRLLTRLPFFHNHMHMCVVVKNEK